MRQLLSETVLCAYANGRTSYAVGSGSGSGTGTGFSIPSLGPPGAYAQQQYAQAQAQGRAQIQGMKVNWFLYGGNICFRMITDFIFYIMAMRSVCVVDECVLNELIVGCHRLRVLIFISATWLTSYFLINTQMTFSAHLSTTFHLSSMHCIIIVRTLLQQQYFYCSLTVPLYVLPSLSLSVTPCFSLYLLYRLCLSLFLLLSVTLSNTLSSCPSLSMHPGYHDSNNPFHGQYQQQHVLQQQGAFVPNAAIAGNFLILSDY